MNHFAKICTHFLCLFLSHQWLNAQVKKIGVVGFTVKNADASADFYHKVLGFKKISDEEFYGDDYDKLQGIFGLRMRIVQMQLGDETIELTQYLTAGGRDIPADMHSNDLYFEHIAIVVSDMGKAYKHLRKYMVTHVSTGPQTIPQSNTAAAGVKAFYFHDPDMHDLELIFFPAGKGQPKWQDTNGKLFLGIDHTAISISNTDSSLHFYRDILGLEAKGESWNAGMEQAHLNNIEGASLHITGLRCNSGVGIEFLQYLYPGPGKPFPPNSMANDIWHWQTSLLVDDAENLYRKLKELHYTFISKGMVSLASRGYLIKSFVVRDPDGHALLIMERHYDNLPVSIRY